MTPRPAWRAFAAASLRSGHLPLWNPFTYGGEPFLAGFQSAVFYPLYPALIRVFSFFTRWDRFRSSDYGCFPL